MLVMNEMDIDLRKYLRQNHNQLTWKDRINISYEIIFALYYIHDEKAVHRDLHSGNILYSKFNDRWLISDLGFCGPADKSSTSIYGNLPYIAPEVIVGREYTFTSDIYSIAILMWEISSGQTPFINYEHENDIVMNIIHGIRPKIVTGTPLEYKNLMKECWDADPLKRLDAYALMKKMEKIHLDYQNIPDELIKSVIDNLEMNKVEENYTNSSKKISKLFKKLQINSNDDEKEITQQQIKGQNINVDAEDKDENSPSLELCGDCNLNISKLNDKRKKSNLFRE
ncbi:kinase-like domain-containing protein [Rhizophagus irregularis DAOM 181602=DAOM 197198]|uniref:Kinase-like domain-containing protein n=1 Tax=Rhizophagus irregularis (strain DAOM 181602 / DAOM 197198 / MUCL 43194) TaxID=747089 RepID=A0A2P4PEI8_RHIID|nr:kinase-like domain-containing protein [Rhizophagus irregularis DAOM 181602=DAOM 197198]POG63798.1 kinase-like domain-containing protein [Rhizophagus irregularis DAOM 181602=DAOM 197198]|eukprot:XP_025170664.1 kinase-like domain-containing protein [Rhizophagus irregularis DAOM 181602=DAOM 197198]